MQTIIICGVPIKVKQGNPLYFHENGNYYEPLWIAGKQHGRTAQEAAEKYYAILQQGKGE